MTENQDVVVVAAACCLRWEKNLCSLYAADHVETEKFSSNVPEEMRQNGIKCIHMEGLALSSSIVTGRKHI